MAGRREAVRLAVANKVVLMAVAKLVLMVAVARRVGLMAVAGVVILLAKAREGGELAEARRVVLAAAATTWSRCSTGDLSSRPAIGNGGRASAATLSPGVPDVGTASLMGPVARHETILTECGAFDGDESRLAPLGHRRRGAGVGGGGGVVGVGSRHCDV